MQALISGTKEDEDGTPIIRAHEWLEMIQNLLNVFLLMIVRATDNAKVADLHCGR